MRNLDHWEQRYNERFPNGLTNVYPIYEMQELDEFNRIPSYVEREVF